MNSQKKTYLIKRYLANKILCVSKSIKKEKMVVSISHCSKHYVVVLMFCTGLVNCYNKVQQNQTVSIDSLVVCLILRQHFVQKKAINKRISKTKEEYL